MLFAVSVVPILIAVTAGIDFSRIAAGRANLQRAVDSAALSGAAVYSVNAVSAQSKAVVTAVAAFCETATAMPAGFALTGTGSQTCSSNVTTGPTVTTQIAGYKAGTPGITPSSCSASNPVATGVTCGFIVTVSASATMKGMLPSFLGQNRTISAIAMAANPFIDVGTAIQATISGSAVNTNSIWLYPLLLNANGDVDFTSNPGAIPGLTPGVWPADASPSGCASLTDCGPIGTPAGPNCMSSASACSATPASGCTDDPLQFTCGAFTMLANTYYNTASNPCLAAAPCYPNGVGSYPQIIAGVIQNPKAPLAIITATTQIGIAFQSVAGGSQSHGYGGYQPNPANGCYYPSNAVYTTADQVYGNSLNNISGGYPGLDWPKVTHWFYSSYLANNYPPSAGEIFSQSQLLKYTPVGGPAKYYNVRIPSIGSNASGSFSPSLATCALKAANGNTYDEYITTTFPSTGATNGSLFIISQAANASYVQPYDTGYAYRLYTPQATPGAQYGAVSCQNYGDQTLTFYWNDMGGKYGDDLDYNNGTVRIACSGQSYVLLIG